jgi:3',5'-cyclic-AMP phosphodiesterase
MQFTRRQFFGLSSIALLGGCARKGVNQVKTRPGLDALGIGGKSPLTFAAINDTHVLDAKSTAIVNRAVNKINAMDDIEFTIVLGDIATDGKWPELKLALNAFENLERPCFCVPGNHDVEGRAAEPYRNYRRACGETLWQRGENGWAFIGLDTCNGTASNVSVPPDRLEWIAKQLRKINPGRPIALFTHHPFNPHTKAYRVENADETLALFAGHNLRLAAAGHYHGNQAEEKDGVLFTTTACCASTRDNFDGTDDRGFRLFRLHDDRIEHEFVTVPR